MKFLISIMTIPILFSFAEAQDLVRPGEKHLANIRQLTFEGEKAEAD